MGGVRGREVHAMADTMGYGQCAGGTHPTGMHSCLNFYPVHRMWPRCFEDDVVKYKDRKCSKWSVMERLI